MGRPLYFTPVVSVFRLSSFFLACSQRFEIRCIPYFHTWCGLSVNLECAARGLLKLQDTKSMQKIATCTPSHNFVGLYLHN